MIETSFFPLPLDFPSNFLSTQTEKFDLFVSFLGLGFNPQVGFMYLAHEYEQTNTEETMLKFNFDSFKSLGGQELEPPSLVGRNEQKAHVSDAHNLKFELQGRAQEGRHRGGDSMSSKENCRNELRTAIRQLSDRCLYSASKWYSSYSPKIYVSLSLSLFLGASDLFFAFNLV